MENWVLMTKKADFNQIAEHFSIDPVIARILRNRDLLTLDEMEEYIHSDITKLHSPFSLKDMEKAIKIIKEKITSGEKIRIIGDYDIDGINAAYILLDGLEKAGARVDVVLPHRMKDGYGINEELILNAKREGVDTIITCDNGISAKSQIEYAKSLEMTVIITDHHEVPFIENEGNRSYILPDADAIINPKQEDCQYPFSNLCGAAVAFKLITGLFTDISMDIQTREENLKKYLENVAIATIGDVMDLVGENRILVKEGLKLLRNTKNFGLNALISYCNIEKQSLGVYHIGFILGPCLNASGRLDTAEKALHLFRAENVSMANQIAKELVDLNTNRKELTEKGITEAIEQIEGSDIKDSKVLIVFLPDCHESLAGIIAGRVRERYKRPAYVITRGEEGLKGSGRSIEAYNMYEEMCKMKEVFTKFGGHPLAAGFSMKEENLEVFRKEANRITTLTEEDFYEKVLIDVPMPISYISQNLVEQLELLEPFGKGNAKPLFAEKEIEFASVKTLGKNQNVLKFTLRNKEQTELEGMYFGNLEKMYLYLCDKYGKNKVDTFYEGKGSLTDMSITYTPSVNTFRGVSKLQVTIQHIK